MSEIARTLQVVTEVDPTLLKVAFASSDGRHVDQHFGSAQAFTLYGVNPEQAQLLSVAQFGQSIQDGNEDKLVNKLEMLQGCIAVYCRACGASAVRQLLSIGVQPIKVTEDTSIQELVEALQAEMRAGPSGWLATAIRRGQSPDSTRFDAMEAEGWQE